MHSVAMLYYKKDPTEVKKAYAYAAVAKMEGIDFFYFSFKAVDFHERKISGWYYEAGRWLRKQMDFPAVIINSCNAKNKKQRSIISELKKHAVFTSFPVGNKWAVYNKLLHAKEFSSHLIPTSKLTSSKQIISFLLDYPRAVIKPVSGNQGKNILFIERQANLLNIIDGSVKSVVAPAELHAFLEKRIGKQKYLLQPFIECKTKNGLTYDFRLHVQKNGMGMWEINLIYPRINGGSKLISNISNGGYRGELEPFLYGEFEEEAGQIKQKLEHFACSFSAHFDTLYDDPFDEIGIDVGIDQNQELWIYEVNWRPGCKNREFEVARRLIPYANFLAKSKSVLS
jgi:glutathione synthase/RimK-type ligase-like ATP-grasp enzyme